MSERQGAVVPGLTSDEELRRARREGATSGAQREREAQ
jgi:hypothetical protein